MQPGDNPEDVRARITGGEVEQSSFFREMRERAAGYIRDPKQLGDLLDLAAHKFLRLPESLGDLRDRLATCLRLVRAWIGGQYHEIPTASLVSIVAALIYFVTPIDLVPDFILALGLVDDAALLGWVLSSVSKDLDRFAAWEIENIRGAPRERGQDTAED